MKLMMMPMKKMTKDMKADINKLNLEISSNFKFTFTIYQTLDIFTNFSTKLVIWLAAF